MNRRGFFGSTLGLFLGSQIPWVARKPGGILIPQPPAVIPVIRTGVRLDDGSVIQGPGVLAHWESVQGGVSHRDVFRFADIEIRRIVTVQSAILFDRHGKIVAEDEFAGGPVCLSSGNTLKVTFGAELPDEVRNDILRFKS